MQPQPALTGAPARRAFTCRVVFVVGRICVLSAARRRTRESVFIRHWGFLPSVAVSADSRLAYSALAEGALCSVPSLVSF